MDNHNTAAIWLFTITAAGLVVLVSQKRASNKAADLLINTGGAEQVGIWLSKPAYSVSQHVAQPSGRRIIANLNDGFCGLNIVHISRLPFEQTGKANWTTLLAVIHQRRLPTAKRPAFTDWFDSQGTSNVPFQLPSWSSFKLRPGIRPRSTAYAVVSRTTLITLLSLCNARCTLRHSGVAGHRAAYTSYNGQWYIEWPLGAPAVVQFVKHDSHVLFSDVYPRSFARRVDKCIEMTAGIVVTPEPSKVKCAFPSRKPPGRWLLEYQPKGFSAAHGSRQLYHMMGGKVYEVDFLFAREYPDGKVFPPHERLLTLPSKDEDRHAIFCVRWEELQLLAHSMDCLPWSPVSWSIHRGLRDLLLSFSKTTMDTYRESLAQKLLDNVHQASDILEARGWHPEFIKESIPGIIYNSVMAGAGDSDDAVRVVTEAALLLWDRPMSGLDETRFWREQLDWPLEAKQPLTPHMVIALTKCFVLEWSVTFDHQIYHDLPAELLINRSESS
ncbi:MAG: hypothetical protein Q9180_002145 [Flavoplaca navasiana]